VRIYSSADRSAKRISDAANEKGSVKVDLCGASVGKHDARDERRSLLDEDHIGARHPQILKGSLELEAPNVIFALCGGTRDVGSARHARRAPRERENN
jgi:hypothetical protein